MAHLQVDENWKLGEIPEQGSYIVAFSPGFKHPVLLLVTDDFASGFAQMLHQSNQVKLIDYSLPIKVWAYAPSFQINE